MLNDPTLDPLRKGLVSYLGDATSGGTGGLSLPQYQGPFQATGNIASGVNQMAQEALAGARNASIDQPLEAAMRQSLSGESADVSGVTSNLERRGRESEDIAQARLADMFSATGGRFSTPLARQSQETSRNIRADTTGKIAELELGASEAARGRQVSALAPAIDFTRLDPTMARALTAQGLLAPQEKAIDRQLAEFQRTQAALLPFAIQMASSYPPVGTSSKSARGGILVG